MKLLIIRHGDPDYAIDSLTETGWIEAKLLAERLSNMNIKDFYVSPLGRAKDTASLTLKKMNRTATEYEWLREFSVRIQRPSLQEANCIWDWLPDEWVKEPRHFDREEWCETEIMKNGHVREEADWVIQGLDQLLKEHGYWREGFNYHVEEANEDTLVLFCHFGVECLMLGHLLNISPMLLWHGLCAVPSSVTTVVTEERRNGTASFRMTAFGDTSHLYAGGQEPSFAARFCEIYDRADQRHD
ncbi:MAG: histidine phosphatase family protein [Lachnospiraceae bacterium]